jgi:hypothetical protein
LGLQDYDREAAFQSLNNIRNLNMSIDLTSYPAIQNMTNATALDNPNTAVQSLFTPINSFWASSSIWGSWFYVILIIFTVGIVYIKSQSLHRTSIAMLLLSLLAIAPNSSGNLYIPVSALHTLYIFTGIALAGVLYSFWVGD